VPRRAHIREEKTRETSLHEEKKKKKPEVRVKPAPDHHGGKRASAEKEGDLTRKKRGRGKVSEKKEEPRGGG